MQPLVIYKLTTKQSPGFQEPLQLIRTSFQTGLLLFRKLRLQKPHKQRVVQPQLLHKQQLFLAMLQ